ncbi:MAG: CHASE3 domain-containing protein, partial [Elusimicrobia bacterium]|nr:CHASE3 domain-containing protein [Elusimicrobiota bacterium]
RGLLDTQEWVGHTQEVLKASDQIFIALRHDEAGQRGFLLSGDPLYLTPLPAAGSAPAQLALLGVMTRDNPVQQGRLAELAPLIKEKLDWIARLVRARRKQGMGPALRLFSTNRGQLLMERIDFLLKGFRAEEERLLAERQERSKEDARRAVRTMLLLALTALLMKLGWAAQIDRSIREREKGEETLRESDRRLNLALDAAKMGAWELDLKADRTTRTLRHDQIFGYETLQEQWGLRRFMREHVAPEHAPLVERAFDEAKRTGDFRLECPIVRRDGAKRWMLAEGVMLRDERGEPARMMGIISDVTDTKEKAAALSRALAEVENANMELESFSYSVSHDLRAPLRAIDGFSRAVLEDCGPALGGTGSAHLARVRAASQRMARLIDDLLNLSRVTRAGLKMEPVNLSELAAASAADLDSAAPGRGVEWVIQPEMRVRADESLMRVVLQNLLGNAWKFTSKTPRPRVEFAVARQEDGSPIYYVRDNGAGFDPAYAHKLFGAFQRLHDEAEYPGTGVGLATVQRVVRRHGGRVWAESGAGRGATFYFTIPNPDGRSS